MRLLLDQKRLYRNETPCNRRVFHFWHIYGTISVYMESEQNQLFFSIIIPAHNEEKYIVSTLEHIKHLEYPKDNFEVIVIENGSKDNTFELAKGFEAHNLKVISLLQSGVSHAKNQGIAMLNSKSNWTIILDADTYLKKDFLRSLSEYLSKNSSKEYSIGTTYVRPIPYSLKASIWFSFYDWGHRLTKASYAIQLVKTDILKQFHFNENLSMGEDLELIAFARKLGKFFLFKTKDVFTSTRRFDTEGWFKIFFVWTFVAMLPDSIKRKFPYKVVR